MNKKFFSQIKKKAQSREYLFLASILALGGFLRLYNIRSYIVFLGDEGRDALVVWDILHGDLTLLGPTSSVGGFFLGPIYYYMMAPFLWLFRFDPVGPAIMVALIGVFTIFLVYVVGRQFFGKVAGLIAALLYAVSPIVIIYSRSSWNPNVFPFFTLSSLYTLYLAVRKNKWWLFALSGFLMGINLQIHYLATFVGVIMFLYVTFVEFKPKTIWLKSLFKRYLLMIVGFLVGISPFIAFEARHQFSNIKNIINFIFNSSDTGLAGNIFMNVKIVFDRLSGGLLISYPQHSKEFLFDPILLRMWYGFGFILGLVLIGYFLYYFYNNFKDKKTFQKTLLIFIWGFVGIGLFFFYKKSVYDYYLGFLFPLPFLLVGLVSSEIIKKYKNIGKVAVGIFVTILLLINFKFTPISTPGNNQVNQMKVISDFILEKTEGQPFNFALSGSGNSDHAYRYFFRLADRDPIRVKGLGEDPERTSVTKQLFVICEQPPCSPLGESANDIAGFGKAEIAEEWDISFARLYKLVHYTGEE